MMTKHLIVNLISVGLAVTILLGQHVQAKGVDTPVGKRNPAQFNKKSCVKKAISSSPQTGIGETGRSFAKLKWTLAVAQKYGGKYARWSLAKNAQITCGESISAENQQGETFSGRACIASGIPCKFD